MGVDVEWKYLNGKCVEMIGLIGNMLENILLEKKNNLELGRDEIYEVDII